MSPVRPAGEPDGVAATLPLQPSIAGSSGSFLVLADDGQHYWCKPLNNRQSPRVPATEQIVGRLGALIDAPVCDVQLVLLDGIVGFEFLPELVVEGGWAHGSLAIDPALEVRELANRGEDDNRRRHAGIFALYDWLAGEDAQWLYAADQDNAYYSHDHGFFLTGPDWTDLSLAKDAGEVFALPGDTAGLDGAELERLAGRLEALARDEIEDAVSCVPATWPVGEGELQAVADFADSRREAVASRLRSLVP